ncbi:hypothetical protein IWQ60_004233 [Tieghemiomyces parasiticus]|uniref:Uncharacterized protein n=1 Tax=Tieghemiomyces parasiticus TaxID=78921 RepID=A0A9W8DU36_9FUNG|nr:hypothetical protein IWQ60_004233 [Tieghemiomyces parasiticus]
MLAVGLAFAQLAASKPMSPANDPAQDSSDVSCTSNLTARGCTIEAKVRALLAHEDQAAQNIPQLLLNARDYPVETAHAVLGKYLENYTGLLGHMDPAIQWVAEDELTLAELYQNYFPLYLLKTNRIDHAYTLLECLRPAVEGHFTLNHSGRFDTSARLTYARFHLYHDLVGLCITLDHCDAETLSDYKIDWERAVIGWFEAVASLYPGLASSTVSQSVSTLTIGADEEERQLRALFPRRDAAAPRAPSSPQNGLARDLVTVINLSDSYLAMFHHWAQLIGRDSLDRELSMGKKIHPSSRDQELWNFYIYKNPHLVSDRDGGEDGGLKDDEIETDEGEVEMADLVSDDETDVARSSSEEPLTPVDYQRSISGFPDEDWRGPHLEQPYMMVDASVSKNTLLVSEEPMDSDDFKLRAPSPVPEETAVDQTTGMEVEKNQVDPHLVEPQGVSFLERISHQPTKAYTWSPEEPRRLFLKWH